MAIVKGKFGNEGKGGGERGGSISDIELQVIEYDARRRLRGLTASEIARKMAERMEGIKSMDHASIISALKSSALVDTHPAYYLALANEARSRQIVDDIIDGLDLGGAPNLEVTNNEAQPTKDADKSKEKGNIISGPWRKGSI